MKLIFIIILFLNISNFYAFECGKRKIIGAGIRIIGADNPYYGQWPWVATLFLKELEKFFCGATLISEKHLLTGKFNYKMCKSFSKVKYILL